MRLCKICGKCLPITHFHNNGRKLAVEKRCKDCVNKIKREIRLLKKIAPEKPSSCQCCRKITDKLCLDHCHKTNKFRGWICLSCNRGIGQLGDSLESLLNVVEYLRGNYE